MSGLFIAKSLDASSTKRYLIKRTKRIFPELWLCVIINFVVIFFFYGKKIGVIDSIKYFLTQLTLFQFYTPGSFKGYGVGTPNGALWTIAVDLQFYIIAILISKTMRNKSIKEWLKLIFIFIMIDVISEKFSMYFPEMVWKVWICSLFPFFWIFLLGMLLYYHKDVVIRNLVNYKWLFIALYFIWKLIVPADVRYFFSGARYNLIETILLIGAVVSIGFSFSFRFKNDYSYGFYLYHMVVINFIRHLFVVKLEINFEFWLWLIMASIVALLLSFVSRKVTQHILANAYLKRLI